MKTYQGWDVSYSPAPIPVRDFDWTATSPDYDVDCDQDGFFRCGGAQVHAPTFEKLCAEIDAAIAEQDA